MQATPQNGEGPGDILVVRIEGPHGFQQAVERVAAVLSEVADARVTRLLIDGSGVSGFESPSIAARHEMARTWAAAAQGRVRVAFVVPGHYIDEERFGVVAGRNFGLKSGVFESVEDAREWLEAFTYE